MSVASQGGFRRNGNRLQLAIRMFVNNATAMIIQMNVIMMKRWIAKERASIEMANVQAEAFVRIANITLAE